MFNVPALIRENRHDNVLQSNKNAGCKLDRVAV